MINWLADTAEARHSQADADEIADLEHLANRLVASPWFRDFIAKCEDLADAETYDGRSLLATEEAQAALGIVYHAVEEWKS